MRPTRIPLLVAVLIVAGVITYVLTSGYYSDLPSPPLYAPVFLVLLAAAEGYTAATTSARLAGRPGTRPIHPLTVARVAVLAKATSPVASLVAGAYAGFLGYVAQVDSPQAAHDVRLGAVGVAASLLLLAAALMMERVCRVRPPKQPDR